MATNDNKPSERDTLKEKADLLSIAYANNISTDKLRDLVEARLAPPKEVSKAVEQTEQEIINARTVELRR